jgi:hypothetical protein
MLAFSKSNPLARATRCHLGKVEVNWQADIAKLTQDMATRTDTF